MAQHQPPWTDKLFKELAERYARGESASAIARHFAEAYGITFSRSAIIGKLHRTGISKTSPRSIGRLRNKSKRQIKAVVSAQHKKQQTSSSWWSAQRTLPKQPPTPVFTADSGRTYDAERVAAGLVKLINTEPHHCLWPIGDPKEADFGFCGARRIAGHSYCRHHLERSTTEPVVLAADNDVVKRKARTPEGVE